jgi:hypothetical protein
LELWCALRGGLGCESEEIDALSYTAEVEGRDAVVA